MAIFDRLVMQKLMFSSHKWIGDQFLNKNFGISQSFEMYLGPFGTFDRKIMTGFEACTI